MNGILEEPFFFGSGGRRLFGVLHRPDGRPRRGAGWLVCSAFGAERTYSHRMMFEFARALSREGLDVLRFDYRGCGDSAGLAEEFTFDDHAVDALAAADELERRAGVPCRGMLGLRLGAAVAAAAAGSTGREPVLVMWEPVADGARYCGELLRAAMANELIDSGRASRTRAEMEAALAADEPVVVDGHPLTRAMYRSLATVDLAEAGRRTAGPVLIVQVDARPGRPPRKPHGDLRDAYARGGPADLRVVCGPPAWLRTKEYDWRPAGLFGRTLEWIRTHRGPARRSRPRPAARAGGARIARAADLRTGPCGDADERPVSFGVLGETVKGILHAPRDVAPRVPAVVMLAAGESCRTSLFYVSLARTLARGGWPVLRFDPRGIGDSGGDLGCATLAQVFREIQAGRLVPDALAAVDFMERELGVGGSVLTGLCGGAITAVLAAAGDRRVVGIAPLELRLNYTPLPRFRYRGTTAQYLSWAQIASSSRRSVLLLTARRLLRSARSAFSGCSSGIARLLRRPAEPGSDRWFTDRLGSDANVRMLRALGRALDRGVPVLCVFGDTDEPRMFEEVLPGLLDGRAGQRAGLERRVVAGADHNFAAPGCAERLVATLAGWLASPERPWSSPPGTRAPEDRAA